MASPDHTAEVAQAVRDSGPDAVYRLGVVTAANFTSRPPTLTVGEGELAREMPFCGDISTYQTGQTVVWLSRPGSPLVIMPLPIKGADPDDPDTLEAYQAPTLQNGWSNFGSGHAVAGYYKQPDGWVRLKGVIGGGTDAATMFTLPEGYRPPFEVYASVISNSVTARLRIRVDGTVSKTHGGSNHHVQLNGITFPTHWNQSAWVLPRLVNNWRWDPTLPGSTVEAFVRDDGWVWWKGALAFGNVSSLWGTLPPEVSPRRGGMMFACWSGNGFNIPVRIDIQFSSDSQYNWDQQFAWVIGNVHYYAGRSDSVVTWTDATLQNGWAVNPPGSLQPFAPSYYKDHMGVVHLRGLANGASSSSDTIFTLPAGYRPAERHMFLSAAQGSNPVGQGRVDVHPTGAVTRVLGSPGFLTLNGVSFRAEQ